LTMAKLVESGLSKENLKNDTDVNCNAASTLAEEHVLDKVKLIVFDRKLRCTAVGRRDHCCCKFQ
jgi:hypothetical protein